MRGTFAIASLLVLSSACSFEGKGKDPGVTPGDDEQPAPDATIDPNPEPDADTTPTPLATMFAASGTDLYTIDIDADATTLVGTIPTARLDGLAYDGTSLIGLDQGGTTLLVIDPATAAITASRPLDQPGLFGLTVIPAGDMGNATPILLAADATGLYKINPGGHVEAVGDFSPDYEFSSDLAWVHGSGLYVTLASTTVTRTDAVKIDPTTGKTVSVLGQGFQAIRGLSGWKGTLYGVSSGGYVYSFDTTTGDSKIEMMGGPQFSEAAQ